MCSPVPCYFYLSNVTKTCLWVASTTLAKPEYLCQKKKKDTITSKGSSKLSPQKYWNGENKHRRHMIKLIFLQKQLKLPTRLGLCLSDTSWYHLRKQRQSRNCLHKNGKSVQHFLKQWLLWRPSSWGLGGTQPWIGSWAVSERRLSKPGGSQWSPLLQLLPGASALTPSGDGMWCGSVSQTNTFFLLLLVTML